MGRDNRCQAHGWPWSYPNYVDSHGQSEIGFAITSLLDFDLLPRIKRINKIKLYCPDQQVFPRLAPAMTRAIRWDLIEQNDDQMIKFATAIRVGTGLEQQPNGQRR